MRFSAFTFTVILLLCGLQVAYAVEHAVRRQLPANETECALISQPNRQFKDQTLLKSACGYTEECGFTEEQSTQIGFGNSILGIEGVSKASGESFCKVNDGSFVERSGAKANNTAPVVPEEIGEDELRGCVDSSETFEVDLNGNGKLRSKNCNWVSGRLKRLRKRCKLRAIDKEDKIKRVYEICEKSCKKAGFGDCTLEQQETNNRTQPIDDQLPPLTSSPTESDDDLENCRRDRGRFTVEWEGKNITRNCRWVSRELNKEQIDKKRLCDKCNTVTEPGESDDDRVYNYCKRTCKKVGLGSCLPRGTEPVLGFCDEQQETDKPRNNQDQPTRAKTQAQNKQIRAFTRKFKFFAFRFISSVRQLIRKIVTRNNWTRKQSPSL